MVALRASVRPTLGMSLLDAASLEAFSLAELQEVVGRLRQGALPCCTAATQNVQLWRGQPHSSPCGISFIGK